MKLRLLFLAASILVLSPAVKAQNKIGYANLEYMITLMPEAQNISGDIEAYSEGLQKTLRVKSDYFQAKYEEFMGLQQAINEGEGFTPEQLDQMKADVTTLAQDLEKLQQEVAQEEEKAKRLIGQKQQELIQPALDRLQKGIEDYAKANSYTYIFNGSANGTSVVLRANDDMDLTEKILNSLGVEMPSE